MKEFTKMTKRIIVGVLIFIVIAGIIGIPYLMHSTRYKTFISNFMDEDDVENAIHVFYTVGDNIKVSGKVTAKLKKHMEVNLFSEYIGSSDIQYQRYSVYRYLVQLNAKDNILVSEDQFKAIKLNDYIQFEREGDKDTLYINMEKFEEK